jgi:hypothetical protein
MRKFCIKKNKQFGENPVLKKLLFLIAAFTSLSAAVAGLHSLFIDTEASLTWTICKTVSAASIVGIGIVTWRLWRANTLRHFSMKWLWLGAI